MDTPVFQGVGRGRRLHFDTLPPNVTESVTAEQNHDPHLTNVTKTNNDTGVDDTVHGAVSSFQEQDQIPVTALTDLVKQIGVSIGENIVSCLKSIPTSDMSPQPNMVDLSKLHLSVSTSSIEPLPFRGDSTDKLPVSDWEESVKVYLTKKGIQLSDQVDEVLSKLQGRARDVVRVGLRGQPNLDLKSGPQPIFDILRQHFSECVTSFMPLADFYETKPLQSETAVDYWIRLNKANDTALTALQKQGKTLDNPTREMIVMFITHCPDPELSLVFSCKPIEEWSISEVQVRLDEHHRKQRLQQRQSTHAVTNIQPSQTMHIVGSHVQTTQSQPVFQPSAASASLPNEGQPLERVITLLERLLRQGPPQSPRRPQMRDATRSRFRGPCNVCGSDGHDTMSHCRSGRLCFRCYAAGHQATACQFNSGSDSPAAQPGSSAQQEN